MANTEELESKLKEQEEMNHREKEEIDRLRYELTINTKLVERTRNSSSAAPEICSIKNSTLTFASLIVFKCSFASSIQSLTNGSVSFLGIPLSFESFFSLYMQV
jgi:hypothetical protein